MSGELKTNITGLGISTSALATALTNIGTLINELAADHATVKAFIDEIKVDNDATVADIAALRAAVVGITAKLDADSGVTDTNYASAWDPAAQTSTDISATAVGTLTASTVDITSL